MKTSFIILIFVIVSSISFSQSKIEVGNKAPDFSLEDALGIEYTLSSYFGKSPVVIYFYPQAGTSGCTKQACAIRDDWNKFEDNNITVLGISTDSKDEIKTFVDDYSLNFPLLSDNDKNVSRDYGVLKENGFAKRVTFIVDMDGNIAEILKVNDIDSHSEYVFNAASKLIKSN